MLQMLIEAEDAHSNPECIQKVVKADLSDSESVQMTKEADDHSRSKCVYYEWFCNIIK